MSVTASALAKWPSMYDSCDCGGTKSKVSRHCMECRDRVEYRRKPIPQPDDLTIRYLSLTKGYFAIVDADKYAWLSQFNWSAIEEFRADGSLKTVYGIRNVSRRIRRGSSEMIWLHRFILGITDPDVQVDHEDHNGLNCRVINLRAATPSQNNANQQISVANTSGYKGVSWNKRLQKWQAYINTNGVRKHLGYWVRIEDAARAYDVAALMYFGKFACTNFPRTDYTQQEGEGIWQYNLTTSIQDQVSIISTRNS